MFRLYLFLSFLLGCYHLSAQKQTPFNAYLPIRESAGLNWSSPMVENEPLIFEDEPTFCFSLYNSYPFYDTLAEVEKQEAFYGNFSSHFRMFQGVVQSLCACHLIKLF